jgi:hypothetical protein
LTLAGAKEESLMPDFDIALRYFTGLPDGYLDDFWESLPTSGFRVADREFQPGPFAAMEWLVPTAVAIYIAKPFFDVVIKRAADDFGDVVYPRLKSGIARLVNSTLLD